MKGCALGANGGILAQVAPIGRAPLGGCDTVVGRYAAEAAAALQQPVRARAALAGQLLPDLRQREGHARLRQDHILAAMTHALFVMHTSELPLQLHAGEIFLIILGSHQRAALQR